MVDLVPDEPALAARLHDALGREMVYRYRLAPAPGYEYVSEACVALSGYTPDEHYADADLGMRLVHPDDRPMLETAIRDPFFRGVVQIRWIRKDGAIIWVEQFGVVQYDERGQPVALEGVVRECGERMLAREAAAGSLREAVEFVRDADGLAAIVDVPGRLVAGSADLLDLVGLTAEMLGARTWEGIVDWRASGTADGPAPVRPGTPGAPRVFEQAILGADGVGHEVRWTTMTLLDSHGLAAAVMLTGTDLTVVRETATRLAQLETAVSLSGDSIVAADRAASILWVNSAFERATGYASAEVVGRNPRILQSGKQGAPFYRVMWWNLSHGRTWRGQFVNRRRDGSLLIEEAVVSPVPGRLGAPDTYVAVKRDVTRARQLRASIDDEKRMRAALAHALAGLGPRATIEETCDDIAGLLCELPNAIAAAVVLMDGSAARLSGLQTTSPIELPSHMIVGGIGERLATNPSLDAWIVALTPEAYPDLVPVIDAGINSGLIVPLKADGVVLGALLVGSADDSEAELRPLIPTVMEVTLVARSLLAPHLVPRAAADAARSRVISLVQSRAWRPVYQPIVDLYTGGVVGFEAFTRFDDGLDPRTQFAAADAAGLVAHLDIAAVTAAVEGAISLPPSALLAVNVAPRSLVHPEFFDMLVQMSPRLILELMAHVPVDDYEEIRAAIAALEGAHLIAMDASGAGEASLRHIVSLRPDLLKLDGGLVHGIDADPARLAMVGGLQEFARIAGRAIIAGGIETELERTTLTELSVRFGQGWLLGAPAPAEAWKDIVIEPPSAYAGHLAAITVGKAAEAITANF